MKQKRNDPKLAEMARQLGLGERENPADRLRRYAVEQVQQWVESLTVTSAERLLDLVAGMLSLRIFYLEDDSDIDRLARDFGSSWSALGGLLRADFLASDTLGLLLSHPAPEPGSHRHYAFIDARGERRSRAYFTAWHEIAHLLIVPRQLSFAGFRRIQPTTGAKKDAVETLVDEIAGELVLFAPFAVPELQREINAVGRLTLDGISRIRDSVAPKSSFLSAAHALIRLATEPMAFMVADVHLKPTEARQLPKLRLRESAPEPKLRLRSVFPNDDATAAGFRIYKEMRVPESSVIADAFEGRVFGNVYVEEDQARWETGGKYLHELPLQIETGRFGPVVYVLVTCHSPSGPVSPSASDQVNRRSAC